MNQARPGAYCNKIAILASYIIYMLPTEKHGLYYEKGL